MEITRLLLAAAMVAALVLTPAQSASPYYPYPYPYPDNQPDSKTAANANTNINVDVSANAQSNNGNPSGQPASPSGGGDQKVSQKGGGDGTQQQMVVGNVNGGAGKGDTFITQINTAPKIEPKIVKQDGNTFLEVENKTYPLRIEPRIKPYQYEVPQTGPRYNVDKLRGQLFKGDNINMEYAPKYFVEHGREEKIVIKGLGRVPASCGPYLQLMFVGVFGPNLLQVDANIRSNLVAYAHDAWWNALDQCNPLGYDDEIMADYLCSVLVNTALRMPESLANFVVANNDVHYVRNTHGQLVGLVPSHLGHYFRAYPYLCGNWLWEIVGHIVFFVEETIVNLAIGIVNIANYIVFGLVGNFLGCSFGLIPGFLTGVLPITHLTAVLSGGNLFSILNFGGGLRLDATIFGLLHSLLAIVPNLLGSLGLGGLLGGVPIVGGLSGGLLSGGGLLQFMQVAREHPKIMGQVIRHKFRLTPVSTHLGANGYLQLRDYNGIDAVPRARIGAQAGAELAEPANIPDNDDSPAEDSPQGDNDNDSPQESEPDAPAAPVAQNGFLGVLGR